MISDSIAVALVSAVGGIIIAYITNVVSQRYQKRKSEKQPKDRMEQMFDGYERLIKQKDLEDERKAKLMVKLEEELSLTREMVKSLEHSLAVSQEELEVSRAENVELKNMLDKMRLEYQHRKDNNLEIEQEK